MTLKKLILFYALAVFGQLTFVNLFAVKGVTPHLVLCLTVAITFIYEEGYRCIPFALLSMILVDICGAQYAGIGALAMLVVGIMVIVFRRELNVEQWAPLIVTGMFSTALYNVVYWGIMKLMYVPMSFFNMGKTVWMFALYNTFVLAILFVVMSKNKKKREKRRYDT